MEQIEKMKKNTAFLQAEELLGLTSQETELLQELWALAKEGGEGLPSERVQSFESLSPCFLIQGGRILLSPVVFAFLEEQPPLLPEGMRSVFPAVGKVYGYEKYLEQADAVFALGERESPAGMPIAMVLSGEPGSGRHYLLEQVCARQNMPLIYVKAQEVRYTDRELQELLLAAGLYGAFVCVELGKQEQEELFERLRSSFSMLGIIRDRERYLLEDTGYGAVTWELEQPGRQTKLAIIEDILTEGGAVQLPGSLSQEQLASRQLPLGAFLRHIRNCKAELLAGSSALEETLFAPDSLHLNLLPSTRTFEELKLPPQQFEQLQNICGIISQRGRVLTEWGFGEKFSYGNGISVLFYGAPGTGKTMAAQVMANALRMPLYRVELSQLVSKYVGETQKNIGKIFDEADKCDCILLFDEADAIFSKRCEGSDAQARYSNAEIAYLLQRMEQYQGVSILATNLLQNFDEAFRRRISYMVHFPMPDAALREELWNSIFPGKTKLGASFDARTLAQAFELSGAAIKNAAFHAACRASAQESPVKMCHILEGIGNEYAKQGRSMSAAQKELIEAYIAQEV